MLRRLGLRRLGLRPFGGGFTDLYTSLFSRGEDGFLFYPMSGLNRLFLLSIGNTGNVTVDGDPVGLALDSHTWGDAVSLATVLAAQSEMLVPASWVPGTNGVGNSATNSPAGTLNLSCVDTTAFGAYHDQSFTTVVGNTYKISGTVSGATVVYRVGTTQNGNNVQADTSASVGSFSAYFVATSTTTWVRFHRSAPGTLVVSAISIKLVPGNHARQSTTTKRPFYKTNSGKPYLLFDGSDDSLNSLFLPAPAMTIACAFSSPTASSMLIGGGDSASNHRAFLSLDASGKLSGGWGAQGFTTIVGGSDIRSTNHVGILNADAASVDLYLDGVQIYSAAPNGSPNGGTGGMTLGAFNNAGTPSNWSNASIFAGLVRNAKSSNDDIANITSKFRSTYQ